MKPTKDEILNYLHALIHEQKTPFFKSILQAAYNIIKDTENV